MLIRCVPHHYGMKKHIFFTLAFIATAFLIQAQEDGITIYGFRQQSTGGMQKRGDIDETGKLVKKEPAQIFKNLIYLASASKARIYPVQMWIKGEAFSVNANVVTSEQLLKEDANRHAGKIKAVVYKAGQTIWKLTPKPLVIDKSGGRAKALAIANDVVVLYKMSGKLRYGVLKKFTDLDPVALQ